MRRWNFLQLVALMAIVNSAAQTGVADPPDKTTRPVVDAPTKMIVYGESKLTRTDQGITLQLKAVNVPPGVYTGWIAFFEPGGTVPLAAGWVSGHVVGNGGRLTLAVHLKEGQVIEGHSVLPGGALVDAQGQDIVMVVRYHGLPDPGRIYLQTHTHDPLGAVDFLFTRHNVP